MGHNAINLLSFDTVDDEVAASRYQVPSARDLDVLLHTAQHFITTQLYKVSYTACELFNQCVIFRGQIAGVHTVG